MDIFWKLEAQGFEKLDVEGEAGQPFVTPDHMGGMHQMIVHGVGKMIGGNSIGF